jgi:hypothetical protein
MQSTLTLRWGAPRSPGLGRAIIWGGRISVRPAHDDHIERAAIAADKVFTRRHLSKPVRSL